MNIKENLFSIMEPEIEKIIECWDLEGIIIETQFAFAHQYMFKYSTAIAYEIITECGGHLISENIKPIASAYEIENEGWMYCFYDPFKLEGINDSRTKVKAFFERKSI